MSRPADDWNAAMEEIRQADPSAHDEMADILRQLVDNLRRQNRIRALRAARAGAALGLDVRKVHA